MKEDEKKPIPWEAVDPKPPVIHSGHLENRIKNLTAAEPQMPPVFVIQSERVEGSSHHRFS